MPTLSHVADILHMAGPENTSINAFCFLESLQFKLSLLSVINTRTVLGCKAVSPAMHPSFQRGSDLPQRFLKTTKRHFEYGLYIVGFSIKTTLVNRHSSSLSLYMPYRLQEGPPYLYHKRYLPSMLSSQDLPLLQPCWHWQ